MIQKQINSTSMLHVGTILRGIYRIDGFLSSGGFGNTYVATNIEFDETVAIKEFFMKGITERDGDHTTISVSNSENNDCFKEQKEKFKKEARRLRKLKNEHIVKVHDLFEENGTAYYVMDYVDGENLAERLERTGKPLTELEVRQLLPQILNALASVHHAGIWHLDLKPSNIMVDKSGNVKLIDFGASKQISTNGSLTTTAPTAISYTQGYAPTEQMEHNIEKISAWTDIYALGATLYALLTNQKPPLPSDIGDDMSADKHLALPFPNGISNNLHTFILKMMQTSWKLRPQSIEELGALWEAVMSSKKIPSKVTSNFANGVDEETLVDVPPPTKPADLDKPKSNSQQQTSAGLDSKQDQIHEKDTKKLADYNVPELVVTDPTFESDIIDNEDSNKTIGNHKRNKYELFTLGILLVFIGIIFGFIIGGDYKPFGIIVLFIGLYPLYRAYNKN